MLKLIIERYEASIRGAILEVIKWVDKHLAIKYSEHEVFHIYDLLQDEVKAATLIIMVKGQHAG